MDFCNVRDAELVKRRGRFIVESPLAVLDFIRRCPSQVRSLFLLEKHEALIESLSSELVVQGSAAPIYVASGAIMNAIVGFPIHRGCLAVGARPEVWSVGTLLRERDPHRLIVTEAISNSENMGGLFRNAAAFGADGLIVDRRSCDPLYRKAIRVSIGTSLWLPQARVDSTLEALERLHAAGFQTLALTPAEGSRALEDVASEVRPGDKIALILGTEGTGLSEPVLAAARARVCIPISAGVDSLNVAAASAVALYCLSTIPK